MKADSCSSLYAVTVIFAAIMVSSCASRPDVLPEAPGSREQYILFQANTDTAHEFGQTPPLTVFTVVEKDQFLQYGESVGSIHYFQEDVTHER